MGSVLYFSDIPRGPMLDSHARAPGDVYYRPHGSRIATSKAFWKRANAAPDP